MGRLTANNHCVLILCLYIPDKLVMIIGGQVPKEDAVGQRTDDIEVVTLDGSPIPECLSHLNPFPFGTIYRSAGAAMAELGMICNIYPMRKILMSFLYFHFRWTPTSLWWMS